MKEPDWSVKVIKAENGFVLEWDEQIEDDRVVTLREVVEEGEDTILDELKCMRGLLWKIKEHFGVYWSKHNEHNLDILIMDDKGKPVD